MLRLLAELNEERIRFGVTAGPSPRVGAPDGSLASSISLWHSSRYKTLILTIEPLGAFQRQLQPRRVDGGWAGGTQQVWRGVCLCATNFLPSTRLGRRRGRVCPWGKLSRRFSLLSHAMVSRRACRDTPPLALHSLTQEHLLPSTSPPASPDASPQASDSSDRRRANSQRPPPGPASRSHDAHPGLVCAGARAVQRREAAEVVVRVVVVDDVRVADLRHAAQRLRHRRRLHELAEEETLEPAVQPRLQRRHRPVVVERADA